ncbi:MAG TPA: hypothetical protein PKA58_29065 [Polyangium sp.]|nr:hypothetical protein [Polyangium sp.]
MVKPHRKPSVALSSGGAIAVCLLVYGMQGCKGSSTPPAPVQDAPTLETKPVGPTMGKLDEKNFSVEMKSDGPYKVGQAGTVEVVLEPKGTFHCNKEYPYKIKLGAPPAGVTYPQAIVKADAVTVTPEKAIMKVPILPEKSGEAKVSGNFYFSVCTSEQCVIENRELAAVVKVE